MTPRNYALYFTVFTGGLIAGEGPGTAIEGDLLSIIGIAIAVVGFLIFRTTPKESEKKSS